MRWLLIASSLPLLLLSWASAPMLIAQQNPPQGVAGKLDATITERRLAPMTRTDYMPAATATARPSDLLRTGLPPWAVISDDWEHAAGIAPKPTGVAVVVDGREGPVFDAIVGSAPIDTSRWSPEPLQTFVNGQPVMDVVRIRRGAVVFSANGKRVAYVGKRAGQSIAVVDGSEGPPFASIDPVRPERAGLLTPGRFVQGDTGGKTVLFSLDGTHVAYVGTNGSGASQRSQVVLDGTAGPEYASILDMLFAGQRHVYLAATMDRKYVAVIDGKPMPGAPFDFVNALMASEDGHIAFYGIRGMTWTVVLDGVEGKAHIRPGEESDAASIALSPKRGRVAYTAKRGAAPNAPVDLYVDGKVARTAHGFNFLTFSPDGTRLAGAVFQLDGAGPNTSAPGARGNSPGPGRRFVFVDDWNSLDYSTVVAVGVFLKAALAFSSDSKRFAFIAKKRPSPSSLVAVVVVDGKEFAGYIDIRQGLFSPNGRRFAFLATNDRGEVAVVDGKEEPQFKAINRDSLTFSPDGSRVGYLAVRNSDGESVFMIDGVMQPDLAGGEFSSRFPSSAPPIYLAFSPNSQRVVRVERIPNTPIRAVNGIRFAPGIPMMPTFSADGRHFAFLGFFNLSNPKWMLFVDGKSLPIDGNVYEVPGSMRFQSDGTLRFLTMKEGWLQAVTVAFR